MSSSDLESSHSALSINDMSPMPTTPTENDHDHDHAAVFSTEEVPFPADVPLLRSCENCRRKKRKCSSHKPTCTRCKAQGEACFYRPTARYFKPLRSGLEKVSPTTTTAAAAAAAAAATHGRKRASVASTTMKSRSKDASSGRPRALSALSAIKKMHAPEGITSMSPSELMLSTASAFSSQPISPMSPAHQHQHQHLHTGTANQQHSMSQGDLISGMSSGSVSASASASADGLAYMGGLAISGAGCAEDTSSGILTPQTSLPQMPMSTTSTPQMLLNGQDFAFGSMSPTMMMSSVPSPLASSMPTTIAASAAAMVAASQQQQQQYFYPQNMAASAAMAAMAAISVQSPAIYPDGEYSQMVFASALSRQQQQQQQNQAAAALMGAPHLNSPPLSTSSFSAASLAGDTPPLGECLSSPYPPMCMSATTPQQQMLSFSAWPAAITTAAAVEPMDAVSVPGQMASMLAPPLMAGIPGSPNIHGNVGLDFILPQTKPGYAAEWLV